MSAILRCYVDEETLKWLEIASEELGREIKQLAEAAIESAATEFKVSRIGVQTTLGTSHE